jgi:hypothetical protein
MNDEYVEVKKFKLSKWFKKLIAFILIIVVLFYVYIHFVEPKMIVVKEYAIIDNKLADSFNGFKIVHFSDIHYGTTINDKELSKIVDKINELNPDVIVFSGDLFDDAINLSDDNINNITNELSNLNANLKKYAVIGEEDYLNKDLYLEIMNNANFTVLENENDLLYYKGDTPIMFIGTPSLLDYDANMEEAINTDYDNEEYFKIWINHEPTIMDELINSNIHPNVILSGHTLGGLINTPFTTNILKLDGINSYTKNYYHKKKISMYISNGLGTHKYNVRFLNPPSINLYRLYNN